jgi:hypothetical protein
MKFDLNKLLAKKRAHNKNKDAVKLSIKNRREYDEKAVALNKSQVKKNNNGEE